jgi:hypothetical protein
MAIIRGRVAFGVNIAIKTPIAPDKEWANKMLGKAERIVTVAFERALLGVLRIFPGVLEVACTAGNTKIEVEKVEP